MAKAPKKPAEDFGFEPEGESFGFQEENPSDARAFAAAKNGQPSDLMGAFREAGRRFPMQIPEAVPDFMTGGLDAISLRNAEYNPTFKKALELAEHRSPNATMFGKGAGNIGLAGLSLAAPEAPMLLAGAQGGLTKPEGDNNVTGDLVRRAMQIPAAMGTAKFIDLSARGAVNVGDRLMQKAVGMGERIPGLGTKMADLGLWGTKGRMLNQANAGIPALENTLTENVPRIAGDVPSAPSVHAINEHGNRLVPNNTDIPVSSDNMPFVQAVNERGLEAAARGNLKPADALDVARKIDRTAYDTATPMGKFNRNLNKADSGALRSTIKDMATNQNIPEVADALHGQQALINARDALSVPESLSDKWLKYGVHGALPAGGMSLLTGHDPATTAAIGATAAALRTPLGMSSMGQLATKGGKALPYLTPMAISADPDMVNALVKRAMGEQ